MSVPNIRNVPVRRYRRSRRACVEVSESDEHGQSNDGGSAQPATSGELGESTGKEACRCTKGVL